VDDDEIIYEIQFFALTRNSARLGINNCWMTIFSWQSSQRKCGARWQDGIGGLPEDDLEGGPFKTASEGESDAIRTCGIGLTTILGRAS
jgi:hypothetical protein